MIEDEFRNVDLFYVRSDYNNPVKYTCYTKKISWWESTHSDYVFYFVNNDTFKVFKNRDNVNSYPAGEYSVDKKFLDFLMKLEII